MEKISKYIYLKYHYKIGQNKWYSYDHYFRYYIHNRPKGNKRKPEEDEYLLTYKQFTSLLKSVYTEAKKELLKGNRVRIPTIGVITPYVCQSKPKLNNKGNIVKGWKPLDWYYRDYALVHLSKKTSILKKKFLFKFRPQLPLKSELNRMIKSGEIALPDIRKTREIYKLYNNG